MATRKNPAAEIDELREEVADLNARLDRVSGITELADAIDTEDGLRTVVDRIALIVDGDDDADEIDCTNCDDEGCSLCDDTIDDDEG
jgi:hypothetical protein